MTRQYGGLASLAGISIGGGGGESSKSMMAQQKIQSLDFFTRHLYEEIVLDLMAVDHWDAASGALVIDTSDVFRYQKARHGSGRPVTPDKQNPPHKRRTKRS